MSICFPTQMELHYEGRNNIIDRCITILKRKVYYLNVKNGVTAVDHVKGVVRI